MNTGARERLRRLRREALAGRAAWSIADQGLSSLSNIAVGIVAARSLSVEQFGTFGLVFTSYILVLGVGRGMISDPLLVRFSAQPTTRVPAGIAVAGAATLYGILAGLLYAAAGVVVGGPILGVLVGFGLALPGLVLQDAWRYVAFSQARPQVAFLVDLVWGAGVAIGLIAVATQGALTLASILWVFGGTAGIAALAGMLVFRALPAVRAAVPFVRAHFDLGGRFMTEYLTTVGVTYLTVYLLGAVAGLTAVAAVRGAQLFFGPINVLFTGMSLVLVPEGVRIAARSKRLFERLLFVAAIALTVLASAWLVAGLLLPDRAGQALLGATWAETSGVLLPYGIGLASGGVLGAAYVGLRAMGDAKSSLAVRIRSVPLLVVFPAVGAVLDGGVGYSIGFAISSCITAGMWWHRYQRSLRAFVAPVSLEPDPVSPVA